MICGAQGDPQYIDKISYMGRKVSCTMRYMLSRDMVGKPENVVKISNWMQGAALMILFFHFVNDISRCCKSKYVVLIHTFRQQYGMKAE